MSLESQLDPKDLGRASLRSQSLASGKTWQDKCTILQPFPTFPLIILITLAIHVYILHSVVDCGRPPRHTNQTRTVRNSNLGEKLCQRPQAIRLREAVAFTKKYFTVAVVKRSLTFSLCTVSSDEFRVLGDRFFPSPFSLDSSTVSRSTQLFITLLSLSLPFTKIPKALTIYMREINRKSGEV